MQAVNDRPSIRTSIVIAGVWLVVLAVSVMQCQLHALSRGASASLLATVGWTVKEWAFWIVLTPLALPFLQHHSLIAREHLEANLRTLAVMGAALCCGAIVVSAGFDAWVGRDALGSAIRHAPRAVLVYAVAVLLWNLYALHDSSGAPTSEGTTDDGLWFTDGPARLRLKFCEIDRLTASGNYVEVSSTDGCHLVRATLTSVEASLPDTRFARVHRSHVVNLEKIRRLERRGESSFVAVLADGTDVPVSRRYRVALAARLANGWSAPGLQPGG